MCIVQPACMMTNSARYQAHELAGRPTSAPGNATVLLNVTGRIDGKWAFKSNTSCATVITEPSYSYQVCCAAS